MKRSWRGGSLAVALCITASPACQPAAQPARPAPTTVPHGPAPEATPEAAVEVAPEVALKVAPEVAPEATAEAAFAASLDRYFASQLPAGEPGGAVLVMKHERIVFARGYGLADLKTRLPISTHTLFNLGSISKTFVANAILQLRDLGKLSLDDNLATYFPQFKHPELAARVQIKHLLTHTSGLPDARDVAHHVAQFMTAKDAENWQPITQIDALRFEPGSRFEYSNPAFNGLALIIEHATGVPWQQYVHDHIFIPAGMTTSTITDGPHPETGVAHAYVPGDDQDAGRWLEADYGEIPTFAAAGNGGVWSSVEELARYELALRHARFLAPATIAESRTVQRPANWAAPGSPVIGWSWFIEQHPEFGRAIGHEGTQGGFRASYVTLPDHDLLVVILTNTPRDQDGFVHETLQRLRAARWLDGREP
ncbi:MAG TPA: serine hydrolase domain-containing protein [Kofleriaceae bacterium]|nr:serine hydrolase domain-containing protein [Kofleriaceae bacterium]